MGRTKREREDTAGVKSEARGSAKKARSGAGAGEVDGARVRVWKDGEPQSAGRSSAFKSTALKAGQGVVYWMSRDQRCEDNWALLHAQRRAIDSSAPLCVVFALTPTFLGATIRHYGFMLRGLQQVEASLRARGIDFVLLKGAAPKVVPRFVAERNVGLVVADYSPLRVGVQWRRDISTALTAHGCMMEEVDAHNIVPVWQATDKLEWAARTIRPRITKQLPRFLTPFPSLVSPHPHPWIKTGVKSEGAAAGAGAGASAGAGAAPTGALSFPPTDWKAMWASLDVDTTVKEVSWAVPGETAAMARLKQFLATGVKVYADKNNDPNMGDVAQSNLSPYIHFGQLSGQRAALEANEALRRDGRLREGVASFLEQLIVRRELTDNYCHYNTDGYDRLDGLYPTHNNDSWAQRSLALHADDKRDYLYSEADLEAGRTHDELWNAAQLEMVVTGKMHGFMRMYWAKKVLEWTPSPDIALATCIKLNDRYELDGRDPNGYVGCAWAVAGLHDQGWRERPVFGKVRYMNAKGCQRKFDVKAYIASVKRKVAAAKGGDKTTSTKRKQTTLKTLTAGKRKGATRKKKK